METSLLLLALPRSRTPLSLPSWRSPSLNVNISVNLSTSLCYTTAALSLILVSLPDSPPGPYWVLSTDYEGHSLVYSCKDNGLVSRELVWILSRGPTLPEETLQELEGILSSIGVDVNKMLPNNQNETYCSPMYEQAETLPLQPLQD